LAKKDTNFDISDVKMLANRKSTDIFW